MEIRNVIDILLVEDNPSDADLTIHELKKHRIGSRIVQVSDGAEALDFLFGDGLTSVAQSPTLPQVILLDLKLPKINGLEVLRRLKSDPRTRRIPVVVLTSSREDRDLHEAYELGTNSYIVKPVEFHQFSDVVCRLGEYWLSLNQPPAC